MPVAATVIEVRTAGPRGARGPTRPVPLKRLSAARHAATIRAAVTGSCYGNGRGPWPAGRRRPGDRYPGRAAYRPSLQRLLSCQSPGCRPGNGPRQLSSRAITGPFLRRYSIRLSMSLIAVAKIPAEPSTIIGGGLCAA